MRPIILVAGIVLGLSGCATMPIPSLTTVSKVELERYLGRWNVIAHFPNFVERGKVATADVYARRADGRLQADYVFRRGSLTAEEQRWAGVAWVTNPQTNAEWQVQLLWPFSAEYRILELDPGYQWSVVASRGGKWLWILARDTSLPELTYQEILDKLRARGLPVERLQRVPQPAKSAG